VRSDPHYRFLLYVTGFSARTEHAIAQLNHACERTLYGRYELVIIDVAEHPEAAEIEKILATPTLIKETPSPKRRITGDLSDAGRALALLGVSEFAVPPEPGDAR
jgi:circadian clock protein KaiB